MITLTTEQAQQIEEALVEYRDTQMIKAPRKALSIIRAARAQEQAEQEPVGYFLPPIDESDVWEEAIDQDCPTAVPLYAAPVQSVSAKPLCWAHWKSPDYAEDPAFLVTTTEKPTGWQTQSANWFPLYAAPFRTKDLTDEIDRLCVAIKAEDDYCVDNGDYMLDSNDCIKIIRGEWVRPDYSLDRAVIDADKEKNK